jgi:hypothetical protein
MVDATHSLLCDWCCKYSSFIFLLFVGMAVDERLEFITCPVDGRSVHRDECRSKCMNKSKNKSWNIWVVGLLITSIKLCRCFNTLCMACPFADFKPIFLHYTKPLSLIILRLMSLFSTFIVFLATFH